MPDPTPTRVQVCVFNTHRDYFDYLTSESLPDVGARVWVPFGRKRRMGIVVGFQTRDETGYALKFIDEIIDAVPIFPSDLLVLCRWVSDYYHAPVVGGAPPGLTEAIARGKSL
jgi:primosomal protein N' (replication factor Y)